MSELDATALESNCSSIVMILAEVLTALCITNDQHPPDSSNNFYAAEVPQISIHDYLMRIKKYSHCSTQCFVLALVYIDRIIQSGFIICSLNVHRILITTIMLAAKFFDDQYYNNKYFARIGGINADEINTLEVNFLFMTKFSLFVDAKIYQAYIQQLIDHIRLQNQNLPEDEQQLQLQQQQLQSVGGGGGLLASGSTPFGAMGPGAGPQLHLNHLIHQPMLNGGGTGIQTAAPQPPMAVAPVTALNGSGYSVSPTDTQHYQQQQPMYQQQQQVGQQQSALNRSGFPIHTAGGADSRMSDFSGAYQQQQQQPHQQQQGGQPQNGGWNSGHQQQQGEQFPGQYQQQQQQQQQQQAQQQAQYHHAQQQQQQPQQYHPGQPQQLAQSNGGNNGQQRFAGGWQRPEGYIDPSQQAQPQSQPYCDDLTANSGNNMLASTDI